VIYDLSPGPDPSEVAEEIIVELPKDKLDSVLNNFQTINEVRIHALHWTKWHVRNHVLLSALLGNAATHYQIRVFALKAVVLGAGRAWLSGLIGGRRQGRGEWADDGTHRPSALQDTQRIVFDSM
jgi:hypothetical protein